jgi:hypothetical protein
MAASLLFLFNHAPTRLQEEDACKSLGVDRMLLLPGELGSLWNSVPADLEQVTEYLSPIQRWVLDNSCCGDYLLIQGDFGATYLMVKFAFENGLVPVYSTTVRDAIEEHNADGSVKLLHHFKHIRFRKYEE